MYDLITSLDNDSEAIPTFVVSKSSQIPLNEDGNMPMNQIMSASNSLSRDVAKLKNTCVTKDTRRSSARWRLECWKLHQLLHQPNCKGEFTITETGANKLTASSSDGDAARSQIADDASFAKSLAEAEANN